MPKRPITAEDLLRLVFVGDPQINPEGDKVLFSKKIITDKNKYRTHLCTVDLEGKVTQWTQGEESCSSGRWSPDGSQIAFTSGREKPTSQIFVITTGGGEARKLTNFPEGCIGGIKWSPDGKWIACTFREELPERTEKAKKEREEKGYSEPPLVVTDFQYRLDGDGYFGMARHKLYLVEVATGQHKCLYEAASNGYYGYDWAPNSQELAVLHTVNKRTYIELPNDQIFRVDLTGQSWKVEGLPPTRKGELKWSPDGKMIAFAGQEDGQDPWGSRNTHLYVVPAAGGEPVDLTGGTDYDLGVGTAGDTKEIGFGEAFEWSPDGKSIYSQIGWHGETQIARIDPIKGGVELLTEGHHFLPMGNLSNDGRRIAAFYGHTQMLPEIAVVEAELGTGRLVPKVLTDFNSKFHQEVELSEPEEVWLDSTDGAKVHAWVMKPIGYLEPKRYPAILEIHGGPHAQYGWVFFHEFQVLAAQGYVVVYSNPRGSKGYGEEHCRAIKGKWGDKDWDDIQTVTRWMQHQPYIHPGQIGIMGGSYGGYMTNWAIGHSDEYRAAITDRCVSNIVSMDGNCDFPFNFKGEFGGPAWGDLEDISVMWSQSPIAYFKNVKTPTLIIHSEGDLRCNIEQGEQVFSALQRQGIESKFVRYPRNTSHGMSRGGPPDLRLHRLDQIVQWWEKHLKPNAEGPRAVVREEREAVGSR